MHEIGELHDASIARSSALSIRRRIRLVDSYQLSEGTSRICSQMKAFGLPGSGLNWVRPADGSGESPRTTLGTLTTTS